LSDLPRYTLVETPDAPVDPPRLDARDFCRPYDRWRRQPRAIEIGYHDVARPRLIIRASDHHDPNKPMGGKLAVRDDKRRSALLLRGRSA
jgi:hypothetical protein